MLWLQKISLLHFKNYTQKQFVFNQRVVGICGNNGMGKTNLLDAIYLACFSKSYFSKTDAAIVHKGLAGMRVDATFKKQDEIENIVCILRENNKKELLHNGEEYKKFSSHIGKFPAVMIAPDDVVLLTGTSDVRRKFIDTLLSQVDADYLQHLITYNKVLQQRNSLLKSAADRGGYIDETLLKILNGQLAEPGTQIFEKRKDFLAGFLPAAAHRYRQIAGNAEMPVLSYYSPLFEAEFQQLLHIYQPKDLLLQRTTIGIHKDDIEMALQGEDFKNIASQGQRKSLLFALKLTEFDYLEQAKGFPPVLLLDDVFEKLDGGRINNLLQQVCCNQHVQVFITDTHKQRLHQALSQLQVPFQMVEL